MHAAWCPGLQLPTCIAVARASTNKPPHMHDWPLHGDCMGPRYQQSPTEPAPCLVFAQPSPGLGPGQCDSGNQMQHPHTPGADRLLHSGLHAFSRGKKSKPRPAQLQLAMQASSHRDLHLCQPSPAAKVPGRKAGQGSRGSSHACDYQRPPKLPSVWQQG